MIKSSVARFARTATAPSSLQLASANVLSSSLSQHLAFGTRKTHQRRNSSSKASIPPNGSPRGRSATPSAHAASSAAGAGVRGRRAKAPMVESAFAHLPSVPSTQHLHPEDVNVSSFFSLHRPISVTAAIPSVTTPASFAQIFDPNRLVLKHQPLEVIKTLGAVVEDLEGPQDGYVDEAGHMTQGIQPMRAGVPGDIPLLRTPQFRPFTVPPVPEAQTDSGASKSKRALKKETKTRTWQTTINVTEQTTPTGQKIYTATRSGPIVESVQEPESESHASIQQPFLERMRIRQQKWEAISVKRQRKLKMKKHKYKKLMKRTRNERRRLGKL